MSRVHYCMLASHLSLPHTSTSEASACPPSNLDRLFSSLELRASSQRECSAIPPRLPSPLSFSNLIIPTTGDISPRMSYHPRPIATTVVLTSA